MNIVLCIIDTLRYDHVGANGNGWIRTPNLDRLARQSWVFDRSYTGSYPTIPHRTDVITGKYGSPLFPWRPLRFDHLTFPQVLREAGYRTQLIHDTPHLVNGGHNFDFPFHAWTQIRGAEVDRPWLDNGEISLDNWARDPLFDAPEMPVDPVQVNLLRTYCSANRGRKRPEDWNAAKLFQTGARWLRENRSSDRFFLWLDCFDPHEPWDAPPEMLLQYDKTPGFDGRVDPRAFLHRNNPALSQAARSRIKAMYAAKVSWMDRWFGELLEALDEKDLRRDTALIVTADHGTRLGEREKFGKGYPVREEEARTPFMVRHPELGSGRCAAVVQPQDIYATVLAMAGLKAPEEIESFDVLHTAAGKADGERLCAMSGIPADARLPGDPGRVLCTFFEGQWYLETAVTPERSRLGRLGSTEDLSASHHDLVEALHRRALDELERRGADPALMAWIRGGGKGEFPSKAVLWDGYPGPAGFTQYFQRLYGG